MVKVKDSNTSTRKNKLQNNSQVIGNLNNRCISLRKQKKNLRSIHKRKIRVLECTIKKLEKRVKINSSGNTRQLAVGETGVTVQKQLADQPAPLQTNKSENSEPVNVVSTVTNVQLQTKVPPTSNTLLVKPLPRETQERRLAQASRNQTQHEPLQMQKINSEFSSRVAQSASDSNSIDDEITQKTSETVTLLQDELAQKIADIGSTTDFSAIGYYQQNEESGDAEAQYKLGLTYANDGGMKNVSKSVIWLKKAAEQGLAKAQGSLGFRYAEGDGVKKDASTAVMWFRKAAEQGNVDAQFNLGVMYAQGNGVQQDYKESYIWSLLASINETESNDCIELAQSKLSQHELKTAKQEAINRVQRIMVNTKKGTCTMPRR
ncbi:tetratricopeptide repeat protein [Endozoicomonas sp.]|uniref:tetratricopeptide repeat protein n=1 Tax=Endozoicomonas sp. TaxID=1892382 RepID=UPI00383A94F7